VKRLLAILCCLSIQSPAFAALCDNLEAYWKMDETGTGNRADSQASNTLTNVGSISNAVGKLNNASQLVSASSKYFTAVDNAGLSPSTAMTISQWVYADSLASNINTFAAHWNYSSDGGFACNLQSNEVRCFVADSPTDGGSNCDITNTGVIISAATWYHVVVVYDGSLAAGSRLTFYVDGSAQSKGVCGGTIPASLQNPSTTFDIGRWEGLGRYFDGRIDEVAFWSRALTSTEVTTLYNSGSVYPLSSFGCGAAPTLSPQRLLQGVGK